MTSLSNRQDDARLAALRSYDVLDSPRERDFDEVAELASEICGTPIAVVNLIGDGRQFFKAEVGLGVRETPLASSFCARAILEEEFLLIPDASKDSRFDGNPLVVEAPHLRFYAGALLKTAEGHAIGTVCVLDYTPRELSSTQIKALQVLARQVMRQLELRRIIREQTLAQEAGGVGTFEVDVTTNLMTVSAEFCRLYGIAPTRTLPASVAEACVFVEDADIRSDRLSRSDGSAEADVEYRIRRADDGKVRWIARRARFLRDETGKVSRMSGAARDVTDRRRAQEHLSALVELGDRLRQATTSAEVVGVASEILGRTLAVSRTGYSRIDVASDLFEVERDWTAHGEPSLQGRHSLMLFPETIDRLRDGETLVVANVNAASWLARDVAGYRAIGTRAQIKVPLIDKGKLVGVLYVHHAAARTWSQAEVDFAHGVADRTYSALARMQSEFDQTVLNEELSHRLKNTLSMVQAIASQTLRTVADREPVQALERRIHALASAHEILLTQSWASAPLLAVARAVLGNFERLDRFEVTGPDISLGPRATMSVSLLLHELTTNAFKYGALSSPSGKVRLSWHIEDNAEEELVVDWVESGGPPVVAPAAKGFGSRLIRMGLTGTGGVDLSYLATGLQAEFRAPLVQVRNS